MHYNITQMSGIIREARKAKGMTQSALADATETTTRTIIAIEKDQRHPTYEVFYKIIQTLDISTDFIFWPERVSIAPEEEQIIREFLACGKDEQEIISETVRAMIQAMRTVRFTYRHKYTPIEQRFFSIRCAVGFLVLHGYASNSSVYTYP